VHEVGTLYWRIDSDTAKANITAIYSLHTVHSLAATGILIRGYGPGDLGTEAPQ